MYLEIYNLIRNKIVIKYSRIIYNCKNVLLNVVASSFFCPPHATKNDLQVVRV